MPAWKSVGVLPAWESAAGPRSEVADTGQCSPLRLEKGQENMGHSTVYTFCKWHLALAKIYINTMRDIATGTFLQYAITVISQCFHTNLFPGNSIITISSLWLFEPLRMMENYPAQENKITKKQWLNLPLSLVCTTLVISHKTFFSIGRFQLYS